MHTKVLKVKLKSTLPPNIATQAELSSYDANDIWSHD